MLFEFFYDYNDTWHSHVLTDYGFLDCFSLLLCFHIDYNDTELDTDILKIIMLLMLLMSP